MTEKSEFWLLNLNLTDLPHCRPLGWSVEIQLQRLYWQVLSLIGLWKTLREVFRMDCILLVPWASLSSLFPSNCRKCFCISRHLLVSSCCKTSFRFQWSSTLGPRFSSYSYRPELGLEENLKPANPPFHPSQLAHWNRLVWGCGSVSSSSFLRKSNCKWRLK